MYLTDARNSMGSSAMERGVKHQTRLTRTSSAEGAGDSCGWPDVPRRRPRRATGCSCLVASLVIAAPRLAGPESVWRDIMKRKTTHRLILLAELAIVLAAAVVVTAVTGNSLGLRD